MNVKILSVERYFKYIFIYALCVLGLCPLYASAQQLPVFNIRNISNDWIDYYCVKSKNAINYDLDAAIDSAFCNSQSLKIIISDWRSQLGVVGQARSSLFPSININSTLSQKERSQFISGNNLTSASVSQKLTGHGLSFNWLLYSSGSRQYSINAAEYSLKSVELDFYEKVGLVWFDVISKFHDLYYSQSIVSVLKKSVANARDNLVIAESRAKLGVGSQSSIYQAESVLSKTELDLMQAEEEVLLKRLRLSSIVGVESHWLEGFFKDFNVDEDFSKLPFEVDFINPHLPYMLRSSYLSAVMLFSAETQNLNKIEREGLLRVDMSAGWTNQRQSDKLMLSYKGPEYTVNFNASVPIFDGFFIKSKFDSARAKLQSAEDNVLKLKNEIEVEISQDVLSYSKNLVRYLKSKEYLTAADKSFVAAKQKYIKGLSDLTEVINSERELSNAKIERLRTTSQIVNLRLRLLRHYAWLVGPVQNDPEVLRNFARN